MAMERIIFLHLIEALGLQKSILHPENSLIHHEFPVEFVDKKIEDGFIWDLADRIIHGGISYQDAKNNLERKLNECLFIKDAIILHLPLTVLKSLRNEIIFYRLDSEIMDTLEWRYDEVHPIDTRVERTIE